MDKLAVVVIHYHLRPGGVTRVIERAVEALGHDVEMLVMTGEASAPDDRLTPLAEPFQALEYSDRKSPDAKQIAEDLRFSVRCLLGRDPDIWHIHNHALGKNSFTPKLIWQLANSGCRLLLQPHDFAEDGRPENYRLLKEHLGDDLNKMLYPVGDHIAYAPINFRDKAFLEKIGIPNVYELPNAVTPLELEGEGPDPARPIVVYPARAIRRKNIGEFILWSLLAPEGYRFVSTLAPQNPAARPVYDEWVKFAQELELPVAFDAGRSTSFPELIQSASALMSTSIAEGFGLAFLEPWLEGKTLIGRNISEITSDFVIEGLNLNTLYCALPVPIEWAGEAEFNAALRSAMKTSYTAYSKAWDPTYFEQAKAAMVVDGKVDFGMLDETLQRNVIRHLSEYPNDRAALPKLELTAGEELIAHNRSIVQERYSIEAYGQRLLEIYRKIAATEPGKVSSANAGALLDEFLKPERFNLLRT